MRLSNKVIDERDIIIDFLEKLQNIDYHFEPTDILRKNNYGNYIGLLSTEGSARDIGLTIEEFGLFIENTSPLREAFLDVILIFLHAFT